MTNPSPAPGWYRDPTGAPGQRYWDGHNWGVGSPIPPRRKARKWPWIIGVAAVLVIGAAVSGGMGDEKEVAANAPGTVTVAAAPPATAEVASQGTEVRDGKFAFVVNSVESGQSVAGNMSNQFMQKTAQGQWVLVHMTVANTSDKPQTFFAAYQKLKAGGSTFSTDAVLAMYLEANMVDINPGNKIQATVAFDVPPGTAPEALEVHDSAFSSGVQVKLSR